MVAEVLGIVPVKILYSLQQGHISFFLWRTHTQLLPVEPIFLEKFVFEDCKSLIFNVHEFLYISLHILDLEEKLADGVNKESLVNQRSEVIFDQCLGILFYFRLPHHPVEITRLSNISRVLSLDISDPKVLPAEKHPNKQAGR
jgi:hypothetical protein